MKWQGTLARVAPSVARLLVQIGLTTAVSADLLSAACAADVQQLLVRVPLLGLFGS